MHGVVGGGKRERAGGKRQGNSPHFQSRLRRPSAHIMKRMLLALALFAAMSLSQGQNWYPCNAMPEYRSLTLEYGHLELHNLTTIMYPRNNYTGEVRRDAYASLELLALQEWNTPFPEDCREPGHYTTPGIVDGTSLSDTLFLPRDLLCNINLVNDTLFGIVEVQTIVMRFKHPTYPDFLGTLNLTQPSTAYDITYPGTANTRFNNYMVSYMYVQPIPTRNKSTPSLPVPPKIAAPFVAPSNQISIRHHHLPHLQLRWSGCHQPRALQAHIAN